MDNTSKKLFKKSVVGGFNRDDVAAYIQELTARQNAEKDELLEKLKSATAQTLAEKGNAERLEADKKELEERVSALSVVVEERDTLSQQLESEREKYSVLSSKLNDAENELAALREEKLALEARVSGYVSIEQELNKNKERIADLELSAIRRASEIEAQARAKMESEIAEHNVELAKKEQEFKLYSEQRYAEVSALVSEISDAYMNVKNAVYGFKTGFKEVVSSLAREIDIISEKCTAVEKSFDELMEKCESACENEPDCED